MADFPVALTAAVDNETDILAKHLNNLETKVGINGSADANSIDYKLNHLAGTYLTADPGEHTCSGVTITFTAHQAVAFGDVCFINSSGEAQLIDADAIATMSGCIMATTSINADAAGVFMLLGTADDATWNWTVGGLIYGSITGTTGNTLTQTQPTGADDVIQVLGIATHANRMLFMPQLIQIEHL